MLVVASGALAGALAGAGAAAVGAIAVAFVQYVFCMLGFCAYTPSNVIHRMRNRDSDTPAIVVYMRCVYCWFRCVSYAREQSDFHQM